MKKWISILVLGLLLLSWAYNYYAPKAIAEALASEEITRIVPEKIKEEVEAIKEELDENIGKLPVLMQRSAIEYKDLANMINEVRPSQLLDAFEELKSHGWETTNEVFDIGVKHIDIEDSELEKFRPLFNEYATPEKIEELISIAEENQLLTSVTIPLMKETAKSILESRKEEIIQKLE